MKTPYDLEDKEKALSRIWLKNQVLKNYDGFWEFIRPTPSASNIHSNIATRLERFFQYKRFIERPDKRDLNNIEDFDELREIVLQAETLYLIDQEKRDYKDAEKGTEKIFEDKYWQIFIIHNHGAACELGKGTNWCTAAPGLEYFKKYYKPKDPLFIFIDKSDPTKKYQFHYGTKQFTDKNGESIKFFSKQRDSRLNELFIHLHMLLNKAVGGRYPIIGQIFETTKDGKLIEIFSRQARTPYEYETNYIDVETGNFVSRDNNKPNVIKSGNSLKEGTQEFVFEWVVGEKLYNKYGPASIHIEVKLDNKGNMTYIQPLGMSWYDYDPYDIKDTRLVALSYDIKYIRLVASYDFEPPDGTFEKPHLEIYKSDVWEDMFKEHFEREIKGKEKEYSQKLFKMHR